MLRRSNVLLLEDIEEAIDDIGNFTLGLTYEEFSMDKKTFNAVVRSLTIIGEAANKLSPEIKTNYNNCIDIARHVYKRELIISYSVYDAKGKQVDGNLAHAYFPSDSNRASDIAERTFPVIASSIAEHIKELTFK